MASLGVNLNESVVELADRMAAISSNMVAVIDEMLLFYKLDLALFVLVKNVEEARLGVPSCLQKSGIWTTLEGRLLPRRHGLAHLTNAGWVRVSGGGLHPGKERHQHTHQELYGSLRRRVPTTTATATCDDIACQSIVACRRTIFR